MTSLNFDSVTPIASEALGGLPQNHFSNGRLYATVAAHGGITDLSYWGTQHLSAPHFFRGAPSSALNKLFRVAVVLGDKRYYPILNETQLFPFGLRSLGEVEGVECAKGTLSARVSGSISGEIIVQASASATLSIDGKSSRFPYDSFTGTFAIPFLKGKSLEFSCSAGLPTAID